MVAEKDSDGIKASTVCLRIGSLGTRNFFFFVKRMKGNAEKSPSQCLICQIAQSLLVFESLPSASLLSRLLLGAMPSDRSTVAQANPPRTYHVATWVNHRARWFSSPLTQNSDILYSLLLSFGVLVPDLLPLFVADSYMDSN